MEKPCINKVILSYLIYLASKAYAYQGFFLWVSVFFALDNCTHSFKTATRVTLANSTNWNLFCCGYCPVSTPTAFGVPGEGVTASISGVDEGAVIC